MPELVLLWKGYRCWVGQTQSDYVDRCPCYDGDFAECNHPKAAMIGGKSLFLADDKIFDGIPPSWCPLKTGVNNA